MSRDNMAFSLFNSVSPPEMNKTCKIEAVVPIVADFPITSGNMDVGIETKDWPNGEIDQFLAENIEIRNGIEIACNENAHDSSKIDKTDTVALNSTTLTTEVRKVKVATFVFFDLETTGLPKFSGKNNVQITEISMVAVGRKEFCECAYPDMRDIRVMHKLSLCVKPRCSVSLDASKLTGLSNYRLQSQEPFDQNTAAVIMGFLSHLQKPVCILAHNGNLFDFPLLKAEFEKLNMKLPPDFYIVDTLAGFRKLGVSDLPLSQKLPKKLKFQKSGDISYALQNLHLYFFGRSHAGNHSSEGDCIALAKVCHKVRDKMVPWIEENCTTFDSIKSMW